MSNQTPTPIETASGRYNSEITGNSPVTPTSASDAPQPHNTTLEEPSHTNNNENNNNNNAATNNNDNNENPPTQSPYYDTSDISVEHVNWLLKTCRIQQESPIVSLRECSSSLFAILYQRLFNCNIPNLELEPNTQEKRLWNMNCVLAELQAVVGTSLDYISADEIVSRNETHIKKLIAVFYEIAVYLAEQQRQQELQLQQQQQQQQQYTDHHRLAGSADVEELSNVDSAYKTQQLVASWKRDIIPPQRTNINNNNINNNNTTHRGRCNRQDELRDLQRRTMQLYSTLHRHKVPAVVPLGKKGDVRASSATRGNKPNNNKNNNNIKNNTGGRNRSASAPRPVLPHALSMPRVIDTEARDHKIERLRLCRVVSEAQRQVRAAVVRRASERHTALVLEGRRRRSIIERDARDMRRWVREEDDKYKQAYTCLVLSGCSDERSLAAAAAATCSSNNNLNNNNGKGLDSLVDPQTARLYYYNQTALRAASAHMHSSLRTLQQREEGKLQRYQAAVTGWRRGTISTAA